MLSLKGRNCSPAGYASTENAIDSDTNVSDGISVSIID
jgi:hypothetical protein